MWWHQNPTANIGCHVGASGHVVFDVDVENGVDGFATLRKLEIAEGPDTITDVDTGEKSHLPPTGWNVETPSGGLHIWYKLPKGWNIGNSVGKTNPELVWRAICLSRSRVSATISSVVLVGAACSGGAEGIAFNFASSSGHSRSKTFSTSLSEVPFVSLRPLLIA